MKRIKPLYYFRHIRIRYRLLLAFLLTSLIPLILLTGYSFRVYSSSLEEKLSTSTEQTLALVNSNTFSELEKYQYLCGSICINERIQEALSEDSMTESEKHQAIVDIQAFIRTQIIYPAQAKNITIYNTEGNIFYDLGYDGFYPQDVSEMLSTLEANGSSDLWTYVRTYRSRDIIVLGRRIVDSFNTGHILGYTLISIDEGLFSETILKPVNLSEGSNIMYLNLDGEVLSSWDRSVALGEPLENTEIIDRINASLPTRKGSFEATIGGERNLITYYYNKNLDQVFVYTMPFSYINAEYRSIQIRLYLLSLILILICIAIVTVLYFSINDPITKMTAFCEQIAEGNLDARIRDPENDELSFLSGSMDHMADRILTLIETQKEQEESKRSLELQMLRYQLNPHFLFNTLNSLHFVAAMNQDLVVSEGIGALSNLLQNTLTNTRPEIPLREEIDYLKDYLAIMKIRYAGNFEFEVPNPDETLLTCTVPNLILQPLAENAVIHGSRDDGSVMKITLTAEDTGDDLLLTLSDDGQGFIVPEDYLKVPSASDASAEARSKASGEATGDTAEAEATGNTAEAEARTADTTATTRKRHKIGVANVHERIRLTYGDAYGLQIQSTPGQGTTCILRLPKIQQELSPAD